MNKIFSTAMIAACGMGIHLRADRPTGGAGIQCNDDWRQDAHFIVDTFDFNESGSLEEADMYKIARSEAGDRFFRPDLDEGDMLNFSLWDAFDDADDNRVPLTTEGLVDFLSR